MGNTCAVLVKNNNKQTNKQKTTKTKKNKQRTTAGSSRASSMDKNGKNFLLINTTLSSFSHIRIDSNERNHSCSGKRQVKYRSIPVSRSLLDTDMCKHAWCHGYVTCTAGNNSQSEFQQTKEGMRLSWYLWVRLKGSQSAWVVSFNFNDIQKRIYT